MLPTSPTTVLKTIPAYVYYQYSDDADIQAFNTSYNELAQQYLDWFNSVGLPIYTGLSGNLLDWMATGLYGYSRPALTIGFALYDGPYNSYGNNVQPYNSKKLIREPIYTSADDDAYKRCLTWHFYKGDGHQFTIPWLKRRIQRFLQGTDGTDPGVSQTYQISVAFGVDNVVYINIISGYRIVDQGAYNTFAYNTLPNNASKSRFISLTPIAYAPTFKSAVDSGALELPFQYTYVVTTS